MKSANCDNVTRIMKLFDTEAKYMNYMTVLWVLRGTVSREIECIDSRNAYFYNDKHPLFWIWEVTNNLIGASMVDGYHLITNGYAYTWYVSKHRTGRFLTYKEAGYIAKEVCNEKTNAELCRLKKSTHLTAHETSNPSFPIYKMASDLLAAVGRCRINPIVGNLLNRMSV